MHSPQKKEKKIGIFESIFLKAYFLILNAYKLCLMKSNIYIKNIVSYYLFTITKQNHNLRLLEIFVAKIIALSFPV